LLRSDVEGQSDRKSAGDRPPSQPVRLFDRAPELSGQRPIRAGSVGSDPHVHRAGRRHRNDLLEFERGIDGEHPNAPPIGKRYVGRFLDGVAEREPAGVDPEFEAPLDLAAAGHIEPSAKCGQPA
jgi:hypothetical protein